MENLSQAIEFLSLVERLLGSLGIWPQNPQDLRFALILSYLIIHVSLEIADLFDFPTNLERVVANLTQNMTFALIVLKLILLRWKSRELGIVIEAAEEDFHVAKFGTPKELRVFLANYEKARWIVGILIPLTFFTAICMYLAPVIDILLNVNKNGTLELNLPYYTRMFYDVTNVRNYALTYLVQFPFVFISVIGYTGPDCLVITLMLHICGQLSVLVERINNLSTDHRECGPAIKELVEMHVRLISLTRTLAEAFSLVLLAQVLRSMFLICLLSYDFLVNMEKGGDLFSADVFNSLSYIFGIILLLYTYCFVGESLVEESARIHRAFSECGWEEMPRQHAKSISICMVRSQEPLRLMAGKFYTLSFSSFTDMMKSSMAYFSVLRNLT